MMAPGAPAWVGDVARFNPVDWAAVATPRGGLATPDWGLVWPARAAGGARRRVGWLAARAFRAYQRSV